MSETTVVIIWSLVLGTTFFTITLSIWLSSYLEAHYDQKLPARLKRFELEPYKKGVTDSTTHVEVKK